MLGYNIEDSTLTIPHILVTRYTHILVIYKVHSYIGYKVHSYIGYIQGTLTIIMIIMHAI